ncbi:MlaD family protein [Candidatus Latescibacterota bacterium]
MQSSLATGTKVGITTILALVILFGGTLWVKQYNPASKKNRISIVFANGNGIAAGDPVSVSGIKVGEVKGVNLTADNKAAVNVDISNKIVVGSESIFLIEDVGLMGDKALVIIPGGSTVSSEESQIYYGTESIGLSSLIQSSRDTMDKLTKLTEKIHDDLDIKNLITSFENTNIKLQKALTLYEEMARENKEPLKKSINNFEEASAGLKTFISDNDSRFADAIDSFQKTTEKITVAVDNLDTFTSLMDTVSTYIESGDGSLARLIKTDDLYEELRQTNASIDSFVTDFKRNPGKYTKDMQFKIRLF